MDANIITVTIDDVIYIYPNIYIGEDTIGVELQDKSEIVNNIVSNHNLNSDAHTQIVEDLQNHINSKADISSVPTKTSQLVNDSNFVSDSSYVHSDNNFTTELKSVLARQSGTNTGDETNSSIVSKLGYTPSNDALSVHLAGSETISGSKIFSSAPVIAPTSATNALVIKDSSGNITFTVKNPAVSSGCVYLGVAGNNNAATSNTGIGYNVLQTANTGSGYNTGIGYASLAASTDGSANTAVGANALSVAAATYYNTAIGASACQNASGSQNTAIGALSLYGITGGYNTALGYQAGRYITDGSTANVTSSNSLYIGSGTKACANGDTNEIVIGYNATGAGSNTITLGNSNITKTVLHGVCTLGAYSTAPTGVEGGIYYNSTDKHFYGYNGTTWKQLDN